MTAVFIPEEGRWQSQVTSPNQSLYFGTWLTSDETGVTTPGDVVANNINTADTECSIPDISLSDGTVPVLVEPVRAEAVIPTGDIAKLRVWTQVFNCYDSFPELTSFTAYPDDESSWIVEGRNIEGEGLTAETHYGLWKVTGPTGEIAPLDLLATQAANTCNLPQGATFPPAVTGDQANLRVWAAVYDCFFPDNPRRESFSVYVDSPQRWIVEGRGEETIDVLAERDIINPITGEKTGTETFTEPRTTTLYYGLYMVDTSTGQITPWDTRAQSAAVPPCYSPL